MYSVLCMRGRPDSMAMIMGLRDWRDPARVSESRGSFFFHFACVIKKEFKLNLIILRFVLIQNKNESFKIKEKFISF